MTPRRSSRARASQAPPGALTHSNSSSSVNSLGRAERSTRSNNKLSSSRRASTNQSQSVDDADARSRHDLPQTRQRRGRDETETLPPPPVNDEFDEEEGEEEEITRCICGQQEYPGLPPALRALLARNSLKANVKDELNQDSSAAASDLLSEDAGSMFIQCDACKVWQHGGCVGIMEEATSPDEYFCEKCRKDLHKLVVSSNGQKSSQYLPVSGTPSPPPSSSSTRETSRTARDKKAKDHGDPPKRRSTMNSREAGYDEDALLRLAIEESKEESKSVIEETNNRRGKRTRSDSEITKQTAKRQRTGSPSPLSDVSKQTLPQSQPASSDEEKSKAAANASKKTRGTVARNQREKEITTSEKEPEKEVILEPTGRRKARSERRKGEESESEASSPNKNSASAPPQSQPTPETPVPAPVPKPPSRKSGRPARRGRVGRNQYTRDRDNANGNGTDNTANSPRRGQSREANDDSPTGNSGANGIHANGGESGKPSRPRYMNPNRTSMNDMRRRVAVILEFISRVQVEMAGAGEQSTPSSAASSNGARAPDSSTVAAALEGAVLNGDIQSVLRSASASKNPDSEPAKDKDFKDMSSVEMMDELTRGLLKWQQEYGKYGEK